MLLASSVVYLEAADEVGTVQGMTGSVSDRGRGGLHLTVPLPQSVLGLIHCDKIHVDR